MQKEHQLFAIHYRTSPGQREAGRVFFFFFFFFFFREARVAKWHIPLDKGAAGLWAGRPLLYLYEIEAKSVRQVVRDEAPRRRLPVFECERSGERRRTEPGDERGGRPDESSTSW